MSRILLIVLLLVGCDNVERNKLKGAEWGKAEMINTKKYQSKDDSQFLETFEMDGYKFVIYNNGYGSAMQVIPLNKMVDTLK